jgi:hypothetical protein
MSNRDIVESPIAGGAVHGIGAMLFEVEEGGDHDVF